LFAPIEKIWANLNAYLRNSVDEEAVPIGTPIFVDLSALWHCCCQTLPGDVKYRLVEALRASDAPAVDAETPLVVEHLLAKFFGSLDMDIVSFFSWTFLAEDSSSQFVSCSVSHVAH
jgi:hypothetical protein